MKISACLISSVILGGLALGCGDSEPAVVATPTAIATASLPPAGTPVAVADSCAASLPAGLNVSFVCIDRLPGGLDVSGTVAVRGHAIQVPDGKVTVELRNEAGAVLASAVATVTAGQAGEALPWETQLAAPPAAAAGPGTIVAWFATATGDRAEGSMGVTVLPVAPTPRS